MIPVLNKDSRAAVSAPLPGMGRKERERQQRRSAILIAAREVFETQGYANATMAQIAERAEFGVGSLYQFFPNKQGLFKEVLLDVNSRFNQGLCDRLDKCLSWKEGLSSFIEYKIDWMNEHPSFQRLVMEFFLSPLSDISPELIEGFKAFHMQNLKILHDIFVRANTEGHNYDPDLMSIVVMGTLNGLANDWHLGLLKKKPQDYVTDMVNLMLGGG